MSLFLNGLSAVSVKLFIPWSGAWTAEVNYDLAATPVPPKGPATIKIGPVSSPAVLVGTIDPDASGRFGDYGIARVIGGAGGWHRRVASRHFHNDAGIFTAALIAATAAEIGERVIVATPKRLGVDFARMAGPASRVLAGEEWHVDLTGATLVAPRLRVPAPGPGVPGAIQVLSWDPHERRASLSSDAVIEPGTVLTDTRFGVVLIRDIEQTFSADGARATAWCVDAAPGLTTTSPTTPPAGGKLVAMLGALARETTRSAALATYRYRVVTQGPDGRLTLQAVSKTVGAPDSIAISPWYGVPGVTATIVPGTEAAVVFLDGDYAQPVVVSFAGKVTEIKIGAGASPVALATLVTAQLNALKAAITGAAVALDGSGAAFKANLIAALATWPTPIASTKLKTD